ncbi:polyphosphate polymerase domain-containing protein, partial [Candidatus Gracilibacteria bacterium]|nr:polyphosphate polymerase domain-containing protein [Candidatus Gracilibacteria bacterium]
MRTNDANLNKSLKKFKAISLSELNAKASFLKRIDRKYLLTYNQFLEILSDLKNDFKVLEIGKRKVFTYDNVYMDTEDYLFYKQHQNKLKSRTKVRTRYYVDSNLAFFEFKQKVNGVTSKFRYEFPSEEHGFMTKGKKRFFDGVWQSIYNGKIKTPSISPAIKTNYKRITMVSLNGDERLTIDFNVKALDLRKSKADIVDLKNLIIIESKSLKRESMISKLMAEKAIPE